MTSIRLRACTALLAMLVSSPAFAQNPPPDPAAAPTAGRRGWQYGVRFGPSFTTLTSVETFDDSVVAAAAEPTLNFGVFATIDMAGPLTFQPEMLFAAKGHRIHEKDAPPINTGSGTKPPQADRVILLRYLEFPLLVRVSRQTRADTSVYVIAGPALALRRNAVIRQVADSGRLEDIGARTYGTDMSAIVGAGLQHQRWLLDARFTRGLRNVAVVPQPSVVKTNAFAVLLGVRL
jgi:hypothetical protein